MTKQHDYDAILVLSFGGPEGMDDIMPFLENVLRGKRVPEERKIEVAHHYEQFGGVSPINEQTRQLICALKKELADHALDLPVYWGNRNWHPFVGDTLKQMQDDGVHRALAFVPSAFSSYSGCRQYREDIEHAREKTGPHAPEIDKLRIFYNHPGFIKANADHVRAALDLLPEVDTALVFTAHSLPLGMAESCEYVNQLNETCGLVAEALNGITWELAYQSRSGPPSQPWLEPDILDKLSALKAAGAQHVVIAPIGFTSDHMEVVYDLDHEAREWCDENGMGMARASTAGLHPAFIAMIRELIEERLVTGSVRRALGPHGPWPDTCPKGCCKLSKRSGASV